MAQRQQEAQGRFEGDLFPTEGAPDLQRGLLVPTKGTQTPPEPGLNARKVVIPCLQHLKPKTKRNGHLRRKKVG